MFIVSGKKKTRKPLGYVADFCPVCRDVQSFHMFRVGKTAHVYFIPLGRGELIRFEGECQQCGTSIEKDPDSYRDMVPRLPLDLEDLVEDTFPDLTEVHAARFEAEIRLANGEPLDAVWRQRLIRESLEVFSARAEERLQGDSHIDRAALLCMLLTVALPAAFMFLAFSSHPFLRPFAALLWGMAGIVFPVGIVLSLVLIFTSASRWLRNRLLRQMAENLQLLNPTAEELQTELDRLKERGLKFARKVTVSHIQRALHGIGASTHSSEAAARDTVAAQSLVNPSGGEET